VGWARDVVCSWGAVGALLASISLVACHHHVQSKSEWQQHAHTHPVCDAKAPIMVKNARGDWVSCTDPLPSPPVLAEMTPRQLRRALAAQGCTREVQCVDSGGPFVKLPCNTTLRQACP
jgi:hypothetical protein